MSEVLFLINAGGAVVNGIWKMQNEENGNLLIAKRSHLGEYKWYDPA